MLGGDKCNEDVYIGELVVVLDEMVRWGFFLREIIWVEISGSKEAREIIYLEIVEFIVLEGNRVLGRGCGKCFE